jgi:hypothetical protein
MKNTMRRAAGTVLCAAAFVTLTATSAQAYGWFERGTVRETAEAAQSDIPTTQAQCRRADGFVGLSRVVRFQIANGPRYYAVTECGSKRG